MVFSYGCPPRTDVWLSNAAGPKGVNVFPSPLPPSSTGNVDRSFGKSERLLKRSEFRRLSEMGLKVHVPHFLFLYLPATSRRLGVTVSSRVGPSVVRNRIKRLVREAYRTSKDDFPLCDITIIAKRGAGFLTQDEVNREIQQALQRMRQE